jgi:hypothetical protein
MILLAALTRTGKAIILRQFHALVDQSSQVYFILFYFMDCNYDKLNIKKNTQHMG